MGNAGHLQQDPPSLPAAAHTSHGTTASSSTTVVSQINPHHEVASHLPQPSRTSAKSEDDCRASLSRRQPSSPPYTSSRRLGVDQHDDLPADTAAPRDDLSFSSTTPTANRGRRRRDSAARKTPPLNKKTTSSASSQSSIATRKSSRGARESITSILDPANRPFSPPFALRDLNSFHHTLSESIPESPTGTSFANLPPEAARQLLLNHDPITSFLQSYSPLPSPTHGRNASETQATRHQSPLSRNMSATATQLQRSASLRPQLEVKRPGTALSNASSTNTKEGNKSQASSKITAFFGWGGNANNTNNNNNPTTPIAESSPTTISSDRSPADLSPYARSPTTFASSVKSMPPQIDITKANASGATTSSYFPSHHGAADGLQTPAASVQIEEMEEEIRDLGAELASSLRRELEMEDELERLQHGGPSRRTSDYYSDEGTGDGIKSRIGALDPERSEEVEKIRRKIEVEKAQMRLQLGTKVTEERSRRRGAEDRIRDLEAQAQSVSQDASSTAGGRVQELESALEQLKRKLNEERQQGENYHDLLDALKAELERMQNERDNLRDETVPQLNARLIGLESNDAELQRLTYENTRLQQQLKSAGRSSIMSIEEEGSNGKSKGMGLSRSASMMRGGVGLQRSSSVKGIQATIESRESLAERVKEIEMQRDALHQALKNLLDRQRFQAREHEKRVRALEFERDTANEASSPRRRAYAAEVKDLRFEINELRKRAEQAMEGKWQVEKNLGGLKTNLDRAEQETSSLRVLLVENDILIPDRPANGMPRSALDQYAATSVTLERAYQELQEAQNVSLEQLRQMNGVDGANNDAAIDALLKSMQAASADRDYAQKQAGHYKAKVETLAENQQIVVDENASLETQLEASAGRIGSLSAQVQRQLSSNASLRERLSDAVGKGEREQRDSADRITALQGRLRKLEDRLVAAQSDSEDKVVLHEDEVRELRSNDNGQIKRLTVSSANLNIRTSFSGGPAVRTGSTSGPIVGGVIKSPRLNKNGPNVTLPEALRTEFLEGRVKELETALAEADREMQEVVQKMNLAQIEVMELQSQREAAMRQTASLQDKVVAENKTMGGLMARWGVRS